MPQPKNAMEIFTLLDKSNCGECGEKTCLAFSGAVYLGRKKLEECPKLGAVTIEKHGGADDAPNSVEQNREEYMRMLKEKVSRMDLAEAAERTGGSYSGGRLTIKVLGKSFSLGQGGEIHTDIHVNPWVAIPFLDYVLNGKGVSPVGNWMSFRELKDGKSRYPLFQKRCEQAMRRIADIYPDLFDDLAHLFDARRVERRFESDVSVVLHPLPKVPLMICYWAPDDGLGSNLNIFFDETAVENLEIGSVFTLGAGLAQMFEKLALRHGFAKADFSDRPFDRGPEI